MASPIVDDWGYTCVGSWSGPRTRYDTAYNATKFSMIVLMTSRTAKRERRNAARDAHPAPPTAEAASASTTTIAAGKPPSVSATAAPAAAPASSWPSAPMFRTPARKAIATATPVSISGMARTSVAEVNAYHDPNDPRQSAARPLLTEYP